MNGCCGVESLASKTLIIGGNIVIVLLLFGRFESHGVVDVPCKNKDVPSKNNHVVDSLTNYGISWIVIDGISSTQCKVSHKSKVS